MRKASGAYGGASPQSLRDRLALLECGVQRVPPPRAPAGLRRSGRKPRRLSGASFVLGAACGAALGCAFVMVLLTYPEEMRLRGAAALDAASRLSQLLQADNRAKAPAHAASFEMTTTRDETGSAPLPLRVVGVDDSHSAQVVLRGLPSTVRLSSGVRQDEHTWALRMADLEGLHALLGQGAPEIFDMAIEVATVAGAPPVAEAHAHVRVSDGQAQGRETAAAAPPIIPPAVDTPFRTEITALPREAEPTRTASSRPPLPDGISTLGGPTGEPTAGAPVGRTIWWKLPAQSWSPFAGRSSGY